MLFATIPSPVLPPSQSGRRLNVNPEAVVLQALQDLGAYRHCLDAPLMKWITKERKGI